MRIFPLIIALLLFPASWLSAADLLRSPPAGTATPQPYAQPQVRPLGRSATSPPLLNTPSQRQPLNAPQPLPRDQPLPQLQHQREQNSAHPAEDLDSLERAR
ncbi:MAG: hypothetical protein ACRCTL_18820 [Pseudomonas sp.]